MTTVLELEDTIAKNTIERKQLHDVTTLAAELRILLVRHSYVLKEEGVRREMEQLEQWLENERKGPAPAGVISEGGLNWLRNLRDRLKLSAEETLRLEGEGGPTLNKEQIERTEDLLKTIRRIDRIIDESAACKPH